MRRQTLFRLVAAALFAGALLGLACHRAEPAAKRPNVVWIVIDAQRADHLGLYGYERDTSPFIDSLRDQALVFTHAISQESYTQASVPSFFTSTYPLEHGVLYDHPSIGVLDGRFVTIAEMLSLEGYATAAFVFNPHLRAAYGFNQGFDLYDDSHRIKARPDVPDHETYETARKMHEKVDRYLGESTRRPVFLYLHYRDVHAPYEPPPPYDTLFWPAGEGAPAKDYGERNKEQMARYDAEIRYTDDWLKKTFEMLAGHGLKADNTLLVLTADHGEEFGDRHPGDPGGKHHGRTLYEEQIHVPLVIRIPDTPARTVDAPVELVDIVPTLLDALGIDPARFGRLRGTSLLPLLAGEPEERRQRYAGGNHGRGTLLLGRWKYHRYHRGLRGKDWLDTFKQQPEGFVYDFAEELYDLKADPRERRNLAKKKPEVVERMRRRLDKLEAELAANAGKPPSVALDDETRRQLEALGYL